MVYFSLGDLTDLFLLPLSLMDRLFNFLGSIIFTIGSFQVSYMDLVFGFLVIFVVASVFWRGPKV